MQYCKQILDKYILLSYVSFQVWRCLQLYNTSQVLRVCLEFFSSDDFCLNEIDATVSVEEQIVFTYRQCLLFLCNY